MSSRKFMPAVVAVTLLLPSISAAQAGDTLLGQAKISLTAGKKPRVKMSGRWDGTMGTPAPAEATLRIVGGPDEGDSLPITLPAEGWRLKRGGKVLRYRDKAGSAGGIKAVTLRFGKSGGKLKIAGGKDNWRFDATDAQSRVAVLLSIGGSRWCTEFTSADIEQRPGRIRGKSSAAPVECPCADEYDSTWEAIQRGVFDRHGCTDAVCHGAAPGEGNLDLRSDQAYDQLVGVISAADPGMQRVQPGDPEQSLLWRKLAAKIRDGIDIPNSPMPLGGAAPLSEDQLRVVERWIYNGAPPIGVVEETATLLSSCLPPAEPHKIPRPAPPDPSEGVEFISPPWQIPTASEDEVCFAFPYDFSDQVPAELQFPCPPVWGGAGESCFAFNRLDLTQDPNSHHSIWRPYRGSVGIDDPAWGPFACRGGAMTGTACDPTDLSVLAPDGGDCGPEGVCVTGARPSVACIGFGPSDLSGVGVIQSGGSSTAPSMVISTEPRYDTTYPVGVANVNPVRGIMVVNSHAFNVTDVPTTNQQWLHAYYAPADERRWSVQDLFDANDIFAMNVPPFEEREYCRTVTFDKGTRVFELYSHTHKRGRLFRTWLPPIAQACTASNPDCLPEEGRTPTLVTTDYSDPDRVLFDPPLALDSDNAAERRIKYCAIYDNGFVDPSTVKRNSVAIEFGGLGCNATTIACAGGPNKGMLCGGDDGACPESECDACPVVGGVTTEDEMFIQLGSYYCPDDTSCYEPLF